MLVHSFDNLTVFQSALFLTNAAVIDGLDFVLVIDPTWLPQEVEEIAHYVSSIRADCPVYLLFTHSDFDHILGAGAFPDATTIASQAFIDNPDKERKVSQILAWDSEYYIRRPYEIRYPEIDISIVDDGQAVTIGETRLTFYHAPGHNLDGLFTVIEPQGILIAGDYLSDIEFPYIYHSSTAYETTLAKLDLILEKHKVNILVRVYQIVARADRGRRPTRP
jgi:glyoxylase-like metal-dependent hydrolase (beta-lactamase superfamily II)